MEELRKVTDLLQEGVTLPEKYRDHSLIGNYKGFCECHINHDWLLIYKKKEVVRVISLYRIGSHSDLFAK